MCAINITDAKTGFPVASVLILRYLWCISCHIHLLRVCVGLVEKVVPVPVRTRNLPDICCRQSLMQLLSCALQVHVLIPNQVSV